jgi:hypothetical protein
MSFSQSVKGQITYSVLKLLLFSEDRMLSVIGGSLLSNTYWVGLGLSQDKNGRCLPSCYTVKWQIFRKG